MFLTPILEGVVILTLRGVMSISLVLRVINGTSGRGSLS